MPKNQVTVKPKSFATFGELLRYLRERAHLSQRELAGLVGYHYSYMSYLEKNMRVPDEASLLGRFIPALRLEDEPELVTRLLELARDRQKNRSSPHTKWNQPQAKRMPINCRPASRPYWGVSVKSPH